MPGVIGMSGKPSRRAVLGGAAFAFFQAAIGNEVLGSETPEARFKFLHENGNSSCTKAFQRKPR